MNLLEKELANDASLTANQLADLLLQQRGLVVHPRSIERALARRAKRGLQR